MKIVEVREKETEELRANIKELRRGLFNLRSQKATEKFEDPAQLKKTKRDIARILTVLREREIEEGSAGEPILVAHDVSDDQPEPRSEADPED